LAITESGKAAAAKVIETFNQWEALINSALSKEEIAMLDQISEKIYQKIALYYGEDVTHEKDL
jgi:DNA-binding MarR family transcriptional regulator